MMGRWSGGRTPGWAASESWLPGASSGAEQRGHFRRPLCLPLYPEEWLRLYGYKDPAGPDFPPLPVAQQRQGFPGSRESAGDSGLLLLGPRPVHSSSLHWLPCPRGPAIHTGHHLPVPPMLTSGHTQQAVPALNAEGDSRKMRLAPFTCCKVFLEGLLTCRQPRMHWVWASPRGSWKVG